MNIKGFIWRCTNLPKKIKKLKRKIKFLHSNKDAKNQELITLKAKYNSLLKANISLATENEKLKAANDYNTMIIVAQNDRLMEAEHKLQSQ